MQRRGTFFKLRPDGPAAWNNLAHVLARQKKREDAIAAAQTGTTPRPKRSGDLASNTGRSLPIAPNGVDTSAATF